MSDNCPEGCKCETFHFCGESGTHCAQHCTCPCRACAAEHTHPGGGYSIGGGGRVLDDFPIVVEK